MSSPAPPPPWPDYLRAAMAARDLKNPRALQAISGVNASVIHRWLAGETAPSAENLRRLVKPLGRSYVELLVAGGLIEPDEARMREVALPERPVGAGVDPELLADVEQLSDAQVQRVKDFVRGIREA